MSSKSCRMSHLLGLVVDERRTIGVDESRARIPGKTGCGAMRFGARAGWLSPGPTPGRTLVNFDTLLLEPAGQSRLQDGHRLG